MTKKFDERGIGWIIAGVIVQWFFTFLVFVQIGKLSSVPGTGGILFFLIIIGLIEAGVCTYGVFQLKKGYQGWIIFFLVYSIIGGILGLIKSTLPINSILYLVGAIILKSNNNTSNYNENLNNDRSFNNQPNINQDESTNQDTNIIDNEISEQEEPIEEKSSDKVDY